MASLYTGDLGRILVHATTCAATLCQRKAFAIHGKLTSEMVGGTRHCHNCGEITFHKTHENSKEGYTSILFLTKLTRL